MSPNDPRNRREPHLPGAQRDAAPRAHGEPRAPRAPRAPQGPRAPGGGGPGGPGAPRGPGGPRAPRRAASGSHWRTLLWRIALRFALAGIVIAALGYIYIDAYIQREFSGKKWAVPAMVYARPMELYPGAAISPRTLTDELVELGYHTTNAIDGPGSYVTNADAIDLHTRGFRFWDGEEPARTLTVRFDGPVIETVADDTGKAIDIVRLEPLHVGGIYPKHNEDRILVRTSDVPPHLIDALIAVEDKSFRHHHGVSIRGTLRALFVNLRSSDVEQGGSTLTQQLVKNFFLTPERSIKRKLIEMAMAIAMETRYSKDEILEAYLNEIYLGQDGHRAIHGFGLASHYYFNRPAAELDKAQAALLVAMVRGPSYYDPWRHPERALERRNLVLQHMVDEEYLAPEEAAKLAALPLGIGDRDDARSKFYPAYLDLVRRQLKQDYSEQDLSSEGLQVFTGLDPAVQRAAEHALQEGLATIEKAYARRTRPLTGLEGAVIVTRVDSGEVLALVGGRHSRIAGFNRALDAQRPVGSLMKPAVYLTALANGRYNLLTPLDDSPLAYKGSDGRIWSPRNYDKENHGQVRLYRALANSYNQSTARLGLAVGVPNVVETIHKLGIERDIPPLPSVLLGAVDLEPITVAGMFQTIASGGFGTPLRAIRDVLAADGKPLTRYSVAVEQKVSAQGVYLLQYALQQVVREGTARIASARLPPGLTVAGKTGTTDDQRDAWFAGYSGDLLAVVWVGKDDNSQTPLTGATGALPIWIDLMGAVSRKPLRASPPDGVNEVWVDDVGGGLSSDDCPNARLVPFIAGTEPTYDAGCKRSGFHWPWSKPAATPQQPQAAPGGKPPAQPGSAPRPWWKRMFGG